MNGKSAISSVTIWGIVLTLLCAVSPQLVSQWKLADPATQGAINLFIGQIGAVVSSAVTLYGRFHASQPITSLLPMPSTTSGTPPAAVNVFVVAFVIGLCVLGAGGLTACATTGSTSATSSVTAALGSVTAAVQAHPAQTDAGRQDAETAFVLAADGVEAVYKAGVLSTANVAVAKSDLETAYQVLSAGRTAFLLLGVTPSASLTADQSASDAAFARVDAEL